MSKACTESKTRLKKDGRNKKSETKRGPDQSLVDSDIAKTTAARIQLGHEGKKVQIKKLDYIEPPELHQCSQEALLISSQDVDLSQREVRWDCQSPETAKKLKKCQGQYSSNEITKIVENFRDTPKDPSLHSVRFCLPSKDEIVLSRHSKHHKEKGKVYKKHKQRVQNRDSLQHMIQLFHDDIAKPRSDFQKLCQRLSDTPVNHLTAGEERSVGGIISGLSKSIVSGDDTNCWSDDELFQDNSFLIEATQNPEKFLNAADIQKQCILEPKHPVINMCKSVPGDTMMLSTSPQADDLIAHNALFTDSFVIPPSCTSKVPSVLCAKSSLPGSSSSVSSHSSSSNANTKNVNKLNSLQRKGLQNSRTDTALVSVCTNKLSHVKGITNAAHNQNLPDTTTSRLTAVKSSDLNIAQFASVNKFVSQNSQSIIMSSLPGASYKTSFRKFNSFHIDESLSGIRNTTNGNKEISSSNLNSSFRKTLSFDSSLLSTSPPYRKNKPSTPGFSEFVAKPKSALAASNFRFKSCDATKPRLTELQNQPEEVPSVAPAMQEDGFDVSLPDDVFQTLLEVDEMLGSQGDVVSGTIIMSQLGNKKAPLPGNMLDQPGRVLENTVGISVQPSDETTAKFDALKTDIITLPTNGHTSCGTTNSALKKKSKQGVCDIPGTHSKQHTSVPKLTETILSPIRSLVRVQNKQRVNSPTCAYFKKSFSLRKNSPHSLRAEKHLRSSLPSSSTPVKHTKNPGSQYVKDKEAAIVTECSASFLDNAFNDSFTCDEALYESQILPVLEKLEAEAMLTQSKPCDSIKCSSKEIEEKRQAALHKRSIKLSQTSIACDHK